MDGPFRFIVKSLKVCCPAEYIRLTRNIHSGRLAEFLGVSSRCIRYWRTRVKKGEVKCEKCPNCPRRPDATPIILPRQQRMPKNDKK